jgi:hypothetical protein
MAEEKEKEPIRAWLLITTEEPIVDKDWPHVEEVFTRLMLDYPSVIRADWVEGPPYDLVVPVVVKDDNELIDIITLIDKLTFSPNTPKEIKTVKVKKHNPDPTKDNEWG